MHKHVCTYAHTCLCIRNTHMHTYTHMHTHVNVGPIHFDGKKETGMIDPGWGLRVTVKCFLRRGCQMR